MDSVILDIFWKNEKETGSIFIRRKKEGNLSGWASGSKCLKCMGPPDLVNHVVIVASHLSCVCRCLETVLISTS